MGPAMSGPKNLPLILLGFALGGLLAAGALALTWPDAPEHPPRPLVTFEDPAHNMSEDEQCAHMPEHCRPEEDPE